MHSFEEIDLEGIDALRREDFIEREGMLFRRSAYDLRRIDESLAKGIAKATIQLQMNHQSLISYGGDHDQQLGFAKEVQAAWLERIEKQFPLLYPWIVIETSPSEVILSLRVVVR
jgi:hypothetical protein